MGKVNESLPPFLAKILLLTQTTDKKISHWNAEGKVYIVTDEPKFNDVLKKFFKGTKQTFIRQLHFYGFKKVDVPQEEGAWGFEHENGLFVKGNTDMVKDIRRKTKVDPDTQKLASYYEVQALKSQVSFLQQIIEELREQIDKVKSMAKAEGSVNPKIPIAARKRQRTKSVDSGVELTRLTSFEKLCASVKSPDSTTSTLKMEEETDFPRTASFGSLASLNSMDLDIESFSGMFSDLELESESGLSSPDILPIGSHEEFQSLFAKSKSPKKQNDELTKAVNVISEATKVNKVDVEKIVNFLSKLSLQETANVGMEDMDANAMYAGCQKLEKLVPLNVRKVGVGAS